MPHIEKDYIVENRAGIHARTASTIVQTLGKFESDVYLSKDAERVNGKSIMGVMMLAATKGSKIHVEVDGPDAEKVIEALDDLFANKFGEE